MPITVGEQIPQATFVHVPYSPELDDHSACGIPQKLSTDSWKGKKVVVFAVPGAFTPSCHANHVPPYLAKYDQLKAKGVDVVALVSANDPFVLSGWSRIVGFGDKILALSDTYAEWAGKLGLQADLTAHGLGVRTGRFALVLDDLTVKYVGAESVPSEVTVSGVDAVLAAL